MVPEAVEAARDLHAEEVAANVIVVTVAERLFGGQHDGPLGGNCAAAGATMSATSATLIPPASGARRS